MSKPNEDKDKNLERYFRERKMDSVPPNILDGYTEGVMHRLRPLTHWGIAFGIPALGFTAAAVIALLLWHPWQQPAPAPAAPALIRDAMVLEAVQPTEDILPLQTLENIPQQMEMVDHFLLVAMATTPAPVLSVEQEAEVLSEVANGDDAPDETLDLLDELELAGEKGQA